MAFYLPGIPKTSTQTQVNTQNVLYPVVILLNCYAFFHTHTDTYCLNTVLIWRASQLFAHPFFCVLVLIAKLSHICYTYTERNYTAYSYVCLYCKFRQKVN